MTTTQKPLLICLDRDGTINEDDNYFLGSKPDWKEQVRILPTVIDGIKLLNSLEAHVSIITNQSGIALIDPEYEELTQQRAQEVNDYVIELLRRQNAVIDSSFICPYVDYHYVKKAQERRRKVNFDYVRDKHVDIKPNIGMVKKATIFMGRKLEECMVYVIGDRLTDVLTGINAGGRGILIANKKTKELGDIEKLKVIEAGHPGKVLNQPSVYAAAHYIRYYQEISKAHS